MANKQTSLNTEPLPGESPSLESKPRQESRRSFLGKLGLGAALLAVASSVSFLKGGSQQAKKQSGGFPGEDSIFHPAKDPSRNS